MSELPPYSCPDCRHSWWMHAEPGSVFVPPVCIGMGNGCECQRRSDASGYREAPEAAQERP